MKINTTPQRKDAILVFFILAFFFAYFYQDGGWNSDSRFSLVFAVVQEQRLEIDTFQLPDSNLLTGDKALYEGHYYSEKPIGPAILGSLVYAPLYWVNQTFNYVNQQTAMQIITFIVVGLPSAIAGSLLYLFCFHLTQKRRRSLLVTLAISLGTLSTAYSVVFFSHAYTSALLFSAFFMIFQLKEKNELWKNGYLFLIGSLLGWAFIGDYPSGWIILLLAIYYFVITWQNKVNLRVQVILLPFLGGIIPIFFQLLYNKVCFGGFFSFAYANMSDEYFRTSMSQGLMGIHWPDLKALFYMTLHPTMGLLWESPFLILSGIGAVIILRERRYLLEAGLATWIIISYLIIISGFYMWWGGYALGPRHLIPILPYFCLLLAFLPDIFDWPLMILGLISFIQMLIPIAGTIRVPDMMILKADTLPFFANSNIYNYCLQQLLDGKFSTNLGMRFLGLSSWASLLPLLIVMASSIWLFFTKIWQSERNGVSRIQIPLEKE